MTIKDTDRKNRREMRKARDLGRRNARKDKRTAAAFFAGWE